MLSKRQVTQLSYKIIGAAIKVHKALGPGLLESVYEKCLCYELEKDGYDVRQQVVVPVVYDDLVLDTRLKLDLLVNDLIVVEVKAITQVLPVHEAQLISYMKMLEMPQGLLINFYTDNIVKTMKPFVNEHFKMLT